MTLRIGIRDPVFLVVFLIQPFDLPERMIGSDPEYFLRRYIAGQVKVESAVSEDAIAEYLRTYQDPATIHAICWD